MPISAGTRLGPYEILAPLDAGGLGEVYCAHDSRLGREVTIKVLGERLSLPRTAVEHPNIAAVYDVGEHLGQPFLVMELLEGTTLRERMKAPIAGEHIVHWAIQAADALAAAHTKGIAHGGIKPEALFITNRNQVKLLDFGVLDRNAATDARGDLYALGKVLDEVAATNPVPRALRPMIRKLLDKDPGLRCQKADDLLADLKRVERDAARPATASASTVRRRRRHRYLIAAAVLATIAIAAIAIQYRTNKTTVHVSREQPVETRLTSNSSERPISGAAVSPDGKYLAYSDPSGIWVRERRGGQSRMIAGTADLVLTGWYPDSLGVIGRKSEGGAASGWAVPLNGGSPEPGILGVISPDGRRGLDVANENQIELVDLSTRERRVVVHREPGVQIVGGPVWSPDGKRFAYSIAFESPQPQRGTATTGTSILESRAADGSSPVWVYAPPNKDQRITDLAWLDSRRMVVSMTEPDTIRARNLWGVVLDASGRSNGEPRRLTSFTDIAALYLSAPAGGNGVTYVRSSYQMDVYIGRLRPGNMAIDGTPQRLTFNERDDRPYSWTPDSKAVIFSSNRNGPYDLFRQRVDEENATLLVASPDEKTLPRVAPGGLVLYRTRPPARELAGSGATRYRLMRVPLPGGVPEEVLTRDNFFGIACARVPGAPCALAEITRETTIIWLLDPMRGLVRELMRSPDISTSWNLSPDGKHQAYIVRGTPRNRIRVLTLDGRLEHEFIIRGVNSLGGLDWSADSKGLFTSDDVPGKGSTVSFVDLNGASTRLWVRPGDLGRMIAIPSPDGKYLALGTSTVEANVWELGDF